MVRTLTLKDHQKIELMWRHNASPVKIAAELEISQCTVYMELKRGQETSEAGDVVMIFRSMEYADAVIKLLGEICTLEIHVAVQHFNRINRCWDVHGNVYTLEATPKEVIAEPLTMFGGTGVEVRFQVSRFSATDSGNERWRIEWTPKGAKAVREKQEAD